MACSADRTRENVAGAEDGAEAEGVTIMTDREDERDLRGMRGKGAPAVLACRE